MTHEITELRAVLDAAQKRREAAALALAPKHKGGEWAEFGAAYAAELAAERALAAALGESYAMPFELPVQWDTGAPLPHLLQSDHRAFLIFFVKDTDPHWDGSYTKIRYPGGTDASKLAIVEFKRCMSTRMGAPNDEVLEGHPLFGKGLEGYRPLRIENSQWLKELETINSVHRGYKPESWRKLSHYFFGFHDSTFECIAESAVVERCEASLPEVVADVCDRLMA